MSVARVQKVGIGANLDKEPAVELLRGLVPSLRDAGFDLHLDNGLERVLAAGHGATPGIPADCDIFIAVGGDGTILRYARQFADEQIPILGLKGGQLGFLTEARIGQVSMWLRESRFQIQERMRVRATVCQEDRVVRAFTALNDIVVHGAGFSRMVKLRTEVDGKLMREYYADGVIVATPTGSTAYSLSAGGPLIAPLVRAMVVTPLNPHALSVRPVVVDADQTVAVHVVAGRSDIVVTVDGQDGAELRRGQHLEVERSPHPTLLVVPDDYDFYALLREKL